MNNTRSRTTDGVFLAMPVLAGLQILSSVSSYRVSAFDALAQLNSPIPLPDEGIADIKYAIFGLSLSLVIAACWFAQRQHVGTAARRVFQAGATGMAIWHVASWFSDQPVTPIVLSAVQVFGWLACFVLLTIGLTTNECGESPAPEALSRHRPKSAVALNWSIVGFHFAATGWYLSVALRELAVVQALGTPGSPSDAELLSTHLSFITFFTLIATGSFVSVAACNTLLAARIRLASGLFSALIIGLTSLFAVAGSLTDVTAETILAYFAAGAATLALVLIWLPSARAARNQQPVRPVDPVPQRPQHARNR